jgi:hypothetical protein
MPQRRPNPFDTLLDELNDWTPKYEYDPLRLPELFRLWDAGLIPEANLRKLDQLVARFESEPTVENATRVLDEMSIMAGRPRSGGR